MSYSRSSPGLRKRQLTPDGVDEKQPLLSSVSSVRARSTTASRYLFVLVSFSISVFLILRNSFAPAQTPDAYALCSPDGESIYTVDDVTPRAQCIVVHGGRFVDTGSLGE